MRTAYVMGAREDAALVRRAQEVLRAEGYSIPNDWTASASTPAQIAEENDGELAYKRKQEIALKNIRSAMTSDLCVLVCGEHFPSIGAGAEHGARLAVAGPLHVINPPRDSVFWAYPNTSVFDGFATWAGELEAI